MIYLDNAATSKFKPQSMIDAMNKELMNSANPGRGGHNDSIEAGIKIFNARKQIKSFFNAPDNYEVIFTKNCSEALNLAITGYLSSFRTKVHVITSIYEHNSILRILFYYSSIGKIDVSFIKPMSMSDNISIADIDILIRKNTKLIILTQMSNVTGDIIDIESAVKIAHSHGIPILIDTAQSAGHVPLDISLHSVDMIASAGHKGLHGPQGTGFLMLNTNTIKLSPFIFGGTGTQSDSMRQPASMPEGYEVGTLNTPGICGLTESVIWTYHNKQEINNVITEMSNKLYTSLSLRNDVKLYSKYPSPVISFNIGDFTSSEIGDYLNDNNIAVRSGLHCAPLIHKFLGTYTSGTVRVSIGYNNSMSDIDYLISVIDKLLNNK